MIRVRDAIRAEGLKAQLILQVHDELIVECPEEEAEQDAPCQNGQTHPAGHPQCRLPGNPLGPPGYQYTPRPSPHLYKTEMVFDFPKAELKPLSGMLRLMERGHYEPLLALENGEYRPLLAFDNNPFAGPPGQNRAYNKAGGKSWGEAKG